MSIYYLYKIAKIERLTMTSWGKCSPGKTSRRPSK